MAARQDSKSAKLIQTLVFHDEPQLALFETDQGRKMLAVAIDDAMSESKFFCSEVLDKAFRAYKNGRVDLNFIFRFSTGRRNYTFDWSDISDNLEVNLNRASQAEINNKELYPDRGFFEEDHTEEWISGKILSSKERYVIDGRWEASDFSRFYTKIGDVYSFLAIVEDLENDNIGPDEKKKIIGAVNDPSWRGGGSYVGFYNDLASHSQDVRPLRVSAIQYASLGHIEVEGRASVFREIENGIDAFKNSDGKLRKLYSALNRTLEREGLKTASKDADFSDSELKKWVSKNSMEFACEMKISDAGRVLDACQSNVLIFTKIIMSYYRRLRDLNDFQREGRLSVNSPLAASTPSTSATPDAARPPPSP
ncbi:hypothetical protein [Lichenifustis flavocetrariae]|uniref:Uncharacterized protein n=1 Tax=Lichenifustis flavocetrariae TaxID=2949735 RepID=A0AA41YZN9_9HYPH|nr:hypothetical protein [Lichenifustis flavocetrariae]MCW6511526.1 hypothetical protein [Lichenifustis flavocetrariae]